LLPGFQASVKETLRRLPDYNCIDTIARFRRSPPGPYFRPLDTLRLTSTFASVPVSASTTAPNNSAMTAAFRQPSLFIEIKISIR
jgi:hypothetical protein